MIPLTLADVASATGGRLVAGEPGAQVAGPVVVDSRLAGPGSLFVAVAGARTDGHDHVADAVSRGAVAALVQRPVGFPAVVVADPVAALGNVAAAVVRRTSECRVIGVTGSSGKTSTKDLVASVLAGHGETLASVGSLNNEIGLPLTVTRLTPTTRYLVLEYSTRGPGHIRYLTAIVQPSVAVVLNVGTAHLAEFGSREAIAVAKGELVEALPDNGVAVLSADDPLVAAMAARTPAQVVSFGTGAGADVRVDGLRLDADARPRFRLVTGDGAADVHLRLSGGHHAGNAAAAAAVGLAVGMSLDSVVESLQAAEPVSGHRMQLRHRSDGLAVIDDAYNANPESMRAGLDALVQMAAARGGHSWAVLGEMRELGAESDGLHHGVGDYAARAGVGRLLAVGPAAEAIAAGAEAAPGDVTVDAVADTAAALELLRSAVEPVDVVLVKASNALALWEIADALLATGTATSPLRRSS